MDTNENDALNKQVPQQEGPQEEPATQLSKDAQQQDNQTRLSKPKKKDGRGWLIVAIALLVAAAIGGGIYYFMNQKDSRHHADADEDEEETEIIDENEEDEDGDDDYVIGRDEDDEESDEEENENGDGNEDDGNTPADNPNAPKPMTLSGDADGYPLTLTLEIAPDGHVTGTYKNESDATIRVTGNKPGDAIRLTGTANRITYTFRIMPEGRLYTGTIETSSGKNMELHLTAQ